ncbi:hypothetical protein MtrunA17_Chr5g0429291 [Medicago truncatula]|uniref:Uncharacterized protein n=1 Tax=Medicago truncatula TaxID=3880 RepID=A0A396HSU8_MEDTR|nr:hypothetical protein MtrunA17_Chr5g0429291 [Medicago truncatula]
MFSQCMKHWNFESYTNLVFSNITCIDTILAITGQIIESFKLLLTSQEHFCINGYSHVTIKFYWNAVIEFCCLRVPFTSLIPKFLILVEKMC